MKRLAGVTLVLFVCGIAGSVRAEDKPDPSGTWKWTRQGRNNQSQEVTAKLKLEGDKLTGHVVGRNGNETAIEDATFKDGEISFKVTQERNDRKVTTTYKGKLKDDTITGKFEFEGRNNQTRSMDWEAKRSKA